MNVPYVLSQALCEPAATPASRQRQSPFTRPLRIFTQDPGSSKFDGAVALVRVPYEELEKGANYFTGRLFRVEAGSKDGRMLAAIDLDEPSHLMSAGPAPSTTDPGFAQTMTYAVATLTYERFRRALGRAPDFAFAGSSGTPRLLLRPRALKEANAQYSRERGALEFGVFQAVAGASGRIQAGSVIQTALSHDIVVHETTHALLDGMRRHFFLPTHPDVLAFHEGFADAVALFLRFSYREVVERAIAKSGGQVGVPLLTDLAGQFYQGLAGQDRPLRTGLFDPEQKVDYGDPERRRSPHHLGEVLLKALFDAFGAVFERKTENLRRLAGQGGWRAGGELPRELIVLLAKEASRLAEQFLDIVIRGVDYCPPLDLRFGEYLRALITADHDIVPFDPWGYRESLVTSFRRLGITVPFVPDLSEEALRWEGPEIEMPPIAELAYDRLVQEAEPGAPARPAERERRGRALGEYVTRPEFLWYLGLVDPRDPSRHAEPPVVESLRTLRRLGPDGDLSFDLVAEVTQRQWLQGMGWFYGGSTLIIDNLGVIRYKVSKHVDSKSRKDELGAYPELAWHVGASRPSPDALLRLVHGHRCPGGG